MQINSKNLHSEHHAELEVKVGYGFDHNGTEFPTITYHITPQGLSIDRCSTDGAHRGGLTLNLETIDALCRVSGTSFDAIVKARAKLFPAHEAKLHGANKLAEDVNYLRTMAIEAIEHNPTSTLGAVAPALLRVLEAFADTQKSTEATSASGCGSACGSRCGGTAKEEQPVRRMKTPEGCEAFTGEQLVERMMKICGCVGQYDCDCTSVKSMARIELWTEYNGRRFNRKAEGQH